MPANISSGMPGPGVDVDAQGAATLLLWRSLPNLYTMYLVADGDGPVHSAVLRHHPGVADPTSQTGCAIASQDIREDRYLLAPRGKDASFGELSAEAGVLGGSLELAPELLYQDSSGRGTSWRCGSQWLARLDGSFSFTAHPWDMSEELLITSPATDPDGYKVTQPRVSGDAVFWSASNLYGGGIMVWDKAHGTRPFVRWPGDQTRAADNLGTDGVDMVWSEGEGKEPSATEYPIRRIMTAPFTSDPAALVPRRLRSQPGQISSVYPWVVGCGYAAFA
jgi:hypothetical protein